MSKDLVKVDRNKRVVEQSSQTWARRIKFKLF